MSERKPTCDDCGGPVSSYRNYGCPGCGAPQCCWACCVAANEAEDERIRRKRREQEDQT